MRDPKPISRADRQGPAYRALVLGLTDLFVGASAIALLLIVATKQAPIPVRIPQTDYQVRCLRDGEGLELRKGVGGWVEALRLKSIDRLPTGLDATRLHVRVQVLTPPQDLSCLWRVKAIVDRHNGELGRRGSVPGPVVLLNWVSEPLSANDAKPEQPVR